MFKQKKYCLYKIYFLITYFFLPHLQSDDYIRDICERESVDFVLVPCRNVSAQ